MPQMMPISWILLFLYFSSLLLLFSIVNFYSSPSNFISTNPSKLFSTSRIWKW